MKRTLASFLSLTVLGALSLMGCDPEIPASTDEPIAVEQLGQKTAAAYCAAAFSCCTTMELPELFNGIANPKDEAECTQVFAGLFDAFVVPGIKDSIAKGRLAYDGAKAATCLENQPSDCSAMAKDFDPFESSADCKAVFVGKVNDGGDCSVVEDCAMAGSVCVGNSNTMLGKCQPLGDIGATCTIDSDCKSDLCDGTNKCSPKKAIGEMCTFTSSCKDSYCSDTNTCAALKATGTACFFSDECQSNDCDSTTSMCNAPKAPICDGK